MRSVSAIIPVLNGGALIADCLRSLEAQVRPAAEIIVVDNGSTDGTPERVAQDFPHVQLICLERNRGFAGGVNRGLQAARGDVLVLVNQDVVMRDGCVDALCRRLTHSGPGIVGCKLLYPDGRTLQHAGGVLRYPRAETVHRGYREIDDGRWDTLADVDYVTGAVFAFDRAVLRAVGPLDEAFYPAYYEEVDYCFRARAASFRVIYDPAAVAIHYEAQVQSPREEAYHLAAQAGRLRFVLKHYRPEQILADFAPAEREYLQNLPVEALMARRVMAQAYFSAMLALLELRPVMGRSAEGQRDMRPDATTREIESALADLHGTALASGGHSASLSGLPWQVEEKPFISHVPLVGRWIARFREAWNAVSTKWFVRAIVQQQNQYNRVVGEQTVENSQRALMQHRELVALAHALNETRYRFAQLEERLSALEQSHSAGDDTLGEKP